MNRYLLHNFKRPLLPPSLFKKGDRVFLKNSGGKYGIIYLTPQWYDGFYYMTDKHNNAFKATESHLSLDRKCKCGHWESHHEDVPGISKNACWSVNNCMCEKFHE